MLSPRDTRGRSRDSRIDEVLVEQGLQPLRNKTSTDRAQRPTFDIFISFRFAEAEAEAVALKAALEAQQLSVFVSNVHPGGNLQHTIADALATCRLAVILASAT
jgi:hypothetical protein